MHITADAAAQARIGAYINAVFIFGWAFGGFSWGMLSDRTGRKKALLLSIAWYGLFTLLTGMMQNWWGIVLCRFMSGFGVGGVLVISITMVSEAWPTKNKAVFIGILSIAFPIGIFSAGLITFNISFWRMAFAIVGILPLLVGLAVIWLVKESDAWLLNRQNAQHKNHNPWLVFSGVIKGINNWFHCIRINADRFVGIFMSCPPGYKFNYNNDGQKERGSVDADGNGGWQAVFLRLVFECSGLRKSMLLCFAVSAVLSFILFKTNKAFSR